MNKAFVEKYFMQMVMSIFALIIYGIGLFFTQSILPWTLGVLLGLGISIFKLQMMRKSFEKAVKMAENQAKGYTQKQYMIRYVLTGALLFVAAVVSYISIVGVFFGLMSMKVGAYAELYNLRTNK